MREWILVLNQSEARVLGRERIHDSLRFLWKRKNSLGRTRNRDMRYGRPGTERMSIKGSNISHSLQAENTPHQNARLAFVRKIASILDREGSKKSFEKLTVFCDSHLAGLLEKNLAPTVRRNIHWIHKNFSKLSDKEVENRLSSDKSDQRKKYKAITQPNQYQQAVRRKNVGSTKTKN